MVGPGLLGSFLDQRLGTSFLTPTGFALGIAFATCALIFLARKLTPPARGRPIPFDELNSNDDAIHEDDSDRDLDRTP